MSEKYRCSVCDRDDLSLTANGRVRSHAANGKRPGPDNPHCPGGSDWPRHDCLERQTFDKSLGFTCNVCGAVDTRPTAEQVRSAERAIASPNVPDEIFEEATAILDLAQENGVQPERALEELPAENASAARALRNGAGLPPNPHRPPLPGGLHDNMKGPRGPSEKEFSVSTEAPSADDFLGGDEPEEDRSPSYFPARYDGSCGTCGRDFGEGDMIRRAPDGDWEAELCCGGSIDEEAEQRPQATAPQLPVRAGRYRGPHPVTGKKAAFTRSTTFASAIQDSFTLNEWQIRMAALGLVKRPELYERIRSMVQAHNGIPLYELAKLQREVLNGITEDARLAAGSKERARKGTILHKHTQEIDMGRRSLGDVPEEFRPDAEAYLIAMAQSGLECIPDLIERSTCYPDFEVAGTFDRILRVTRDHETVTLDEGRRVTLHEGEFVIGDVKSGTDLKYAWLEIVIQLAVYAHGVEESGVAVPDTGPQGMPVWRWASLAEFGIDRFRTDVAIVMHVPYGEHRAQIKYADLITGWRGAKICRNAIEYLKIKPSDAAVADYVSAPEVKREQTFVPAGAQAKSKDWTKPRRTWEDVAAVVKTPDEANEVWRKMKEKGIEPDRIARVVKIMKVALA